MAQIKPVYMVCAESGSQDRLSNMISLFNIIEKITIRAKLAQAGVPAFRQSFRMYIAAVWMKDIAGDLEFEGQAGLRLPDGSEVTVADLPQQTAKGAGPLIRTIGIIEGDPPFTSSGLVRVFIRVRAAGGGDWSEQEYPILIDYAEEAATAP